MSDKKIYDFLLDETFKAQQNSSDFIQYKGAYLERLGCYRISLFGRVIDFPSGWAFFPEFPSAKQVTTDEVAKSSLHQVFQSHFNLKMDEIEFKFSNDGSFYFNYKLHRRLGQDLAS